MRKYQDVYNVINATARAIATEVFGLRGSSVDGFIETYTNVRYRNACKLIREGRATEAELVERYAQER